MKAMSLSLSLGLGLVQKPGLFETEPYNYFQDFINPENERFRSLNAILVNLGLHFSIVSFGKNRHFFVSGGGREKPEKVFLAHYDSTPGSPGANDNASGVFVLLATALELRKKTTPWMIIFTDKEEISDGEGIKTQGSFLLAKGLKGTDLAGADFFVFDACGRGDTLVISTIADKIMKNEHGVGIAHIQQRLVKLRENAAYAAGRAFGAKHLQLPTPFSDDAGFLHAGLAAQTITVLPQSEASSFAQLARTRDDYIKALINKSFRDGIDINQIPQSWRLINCTDDNLQSITPEIFTVMAKFALCL
jgi:hypothetical protein